MRREPDVPPQLSLKCFRDGAMIIVSCKGLSLVCIPLNLGDGIFSFTKVSPACTHKINICSLEKWVYDHNESKAEFILCEATGPLLGLTLSNPGL